MDQIHLVGRHLGVHLAEDAVHFIDVLAAVDGHVGVLLLAQIEHALHALQHAVDLALATVELGDFVQASADFVAVQATGHGQRAVILGRDDAEVVAEDQAVKLGVMAQQTVRLPVDLPELAGHTGGGHDLGLAPADLDADHVDLEPWVTHVLGGAQFLERVLRVVVRLKVQRHKPVPVHIGWSDRRGEQLHRRWRRSGALGRRAYSGCPAHCAASVWSYPKNSLSRSTRDVL